MQARTVTHHNHFLLFDGVKGAQTASYYFVTRRRGVTLNEVLNLLIYILQNLLITRYELTPVSQNKTSLDIGCNWIYENKYSLERKYCNTTYFFLHVRIF